MRNVWSISKITISQKVVAKKAVNQSSTLICLLVYTSNVILIINTDSIVQNVPDRVLPDGEIAAFIYGLLTKSTQDF